MPEHLPEDMPGRMPEDMPDRMPDRMPENMSDGRMPEDLPVTKCINVMVGITRSKVILHMLGLLRRANHWSWKADKSRPRKPYTGRPQRLRKTDTLRDSGSRSCCLLYTSTVEGVQNTTATFSLRGCLNGFSVCFLSSPWPWLPVTHGRDSSTAIWRLQTQTWSWPTMIHGKTWQYPSLTPQGLARLDPSTCRLDVFRINKCKND